MSDLLKEFEDLVLSHDLTYNYAEGNAYLRGFYNYQSVVEFSKRIPRSEAIRIWNSVVDRKIKKEEREKFYWNK